MKMAGKLVMVVGVVYFGVAAYHDLYLNRFCGCGPPSELLLNGSPSEEALLAELTRSVPLMKRTHQRNPSEFPWLYRKLYPLPEDYVEVKGDDPGLVRAAAGILQARQSLPVHCLSRGVKNPEGTSEPFVTAYLPRLEFRSIQKVTQRN